jgi:putative transposase
MANGVLLFSCVWEKLNSLIRERVRLREGRQAQASAMLLDSQSAKSVEGGEKIGFDAWKRVHGRKRNIITDTTGWVVVAKVTAANMQDVFAEGQVLLKLRSRKKSVVRLQKIFADGGYQGHLLNWVKNKLHAGMKIVPKMQNQKGFQVLPKRWVIERTFA